MSNPFPLPKERLLDAYRKMRTIRDFEERLHVDFARGEIPGFVHLYAGEEATAVGIMMHLHERDRIASVLAALSEGLCVLDSAGLVVSANAAEFSVTLIPHTQSAVTLGTAERGALIDVEADVMAKYVERGVVGRMAALEARVLELEAELAKRK